MRLRILLIGVATLSLAACDVIRVPGDGRPAPTPPAEIPDGAPGPQPPATPVENPYGEDDVIPGNVDSGDNASSDETTDEVEGGPGANEATDGELTDSSEPRTPDDSNTVTVPEDDSENVEPLPVKFSYYAPGVLIPGSGIGAGDETIYAPGIVFPIKDAPAYPQSQVWRFGGGLGGGDQCDPRNFDTPWQDNFCETRSKTRNTPHCPTNKVHQGQDIRVGTPEGCNQMRAAAPGDRTLYEAVATEDGEIIYQGGYYIQLRGAATGNIYTYIHLNMAALKVAVGDQVTAGQSLGYVSNDFGGTPTTFHLHFEIKAPLEGEGITHVPPYMSLVKAYERREQGLGERLEDDTFSVATVLTPPPDFEIIE